MYLKNKYSFFFFFIVFLNFLSANNFVDEINIIESSRNKIWLNFLDIIEGEDRDNIKDVKIISDTGEIPFISQKFTRKILKGAIYEN